MRVIPILIGALGTVSTNTKLSYGKLSLPDFFVHSCQPSLELLTPSGKCCACKKREVAEKWLKRPTKIPENWRES